MSVCVTRGGRGVRPGRPFVLNGVVKGREVRDRDEVLTEP
jgi:hypothetical protein